MVEIELRYQKSLAVQCTLQWQSIWFDSVRVFPDSSLVPETSFWLSTLDSIEKKYMRFNLMYLIGLLMNSKEYDQIRLPWLETRQNHFSSGQIESANCPMRFQVGFFLISKSFDLCLTFYLWRCWFLPCLGKEGFRSEWYFRHQSWTHAVSEENPNTSTRENQHEWYWK